MYYRLYLNVEQPPRSYCRNKSLNSSSHKCVDAPTPASAHMQICYHLVFSLISVGKANIWRFYFWRAQTICSVYNWRRYYYKDKKLQNIPDEAIRTGVPYFDTEIILPGDSSVVSYGTRGIAVRGRGHIILIIVIKVLGFRIKISHYILI